jgi:hypothetical protein
MTQITTGQMFKLAGCDEKPGNEANSL